MQSRDPRYDGFFVVAVTSTGVYCRPSCPARPPSRRNVRPLPSAAAAQEEGFRACKRCDPDAAPGSPAWNRRADVAGRAVRLIADGAADREGVGGLAARLHFSKRQLNRILVSELGAGPVALARAQRAQTARTLIQSTNLPFGQVALGAGFRSVRQFNDTVRAIYARTPTELRRRGRSHRAASGAIQLRLPYRAPFDGDSLIAFLAERAIAGVEEVDGSTYRRSLSLDHGAGIVSLTPAARFVRCELPLDDLRDLTAAGGRSRRSCASALACACPAAWMGSSSPCGRSSTSRCPYLRRGRWSGASPRPTASRCPSPTAGSPTAFRARPRWQRPIPARFPSRASARRHCGRWRGSARPASSAWTRAPTARRRSACSPASRAWARGPRRTWRCARSGTRTCSCRATWAFGTRSGGSAATRPTSAGGPGAPTP